MKKDPVEGTMFERKDKSMSEQKEKGKVKMGSRICMNTSCGTATTHEWKKGWPLRSGAVADLCYSCGSAYEASNFCDTFHLEQSGWRNCYLCSKRLHCGCRAGDFMLELLDYGGVACTNCVRSPQFNMLRRKNSSDGFAALTLSTMSDVQTGTIEASRNGGGDSVDLGRLAQLCKIVEANEPDLFPQSRDTKPSLNQDKPDQIGDLTMNFQTTPQSRELETRERQEPVVQQQPSLSMNFGASPGTPNLQFSSNQMKASGSFPKAQAPRPLLPKPTKPTTSITTTPETSKSAPPQTSKSAPAIQFRVARPPVEGRGKNHLLPRYWPRITDQELQKISGDLNSTVVPLFEKVLSASDAGRIGRLVLPKACAEAYFPPINQSEGLPIRIQDVKGKEWTFQFRFWPNNNSRMYVLEGVTPCIQSMQLQAGDTVIFSRIDPGGKLVIGFRKASNNEDLQDGPQMSTIQNGTTSTTEPSSSNACENSPTVGSSNSNIKLELNGGHANGFSEHKISADIQMDGDSKKNGEDPPIPPRPGKKRTRIHWSKHNKRLLLHGLDSMQAVLTLDEAEVLLRVPPGARADVTSIDGFEFEAFDEPPVLGKLTLFTCQRSGEQDQWAKCDDCHKWRRLPVDVLLPPTWCCNENEWDSSRRTCSVPEEVSWKELESLLKQPRESKRRRMMESQEEHEPCGLDALASAAVLGELLGEAGDQSVGATTTRHPRHRPGCSCIVCIQPPSGKGKHKSTCNCPVCLTVKRRFKTLMMRKKKRLSDRAAEEAALFSFPDELKTSNGITIATTSETNIDLNAHPTRDEMQAEELVAMSLDLTGPSENRTQEAPSETVVSNDQEGETGNEGYRVPRLEDRDLS